MLSALLSDAFVPVRVRVLRASVTISGPCVASCRGTVVGGGVIIGRRDDGSLVVATARHLARSVTKPAPLQRAPAWREAELLTTSRASDVSLIVVAALPGDSISVAPFALEPAAPSGSIIGAAYGHSWSVSPYRYVSTNTEGSFLVDCATCGPGDSGGGAFDPHGRLAGMLVSEQRVIEPGEPPDFARRTTRFRVIDVSTIRALWKASRNMRAPRPAPRALDPWSRFPVLPAF